MSKRTVVNEDPARVTVVINVELGCTDRVRGDGQCGKPATHVPQDFLMDEWNGTAWCEKHAKKHRDRVPCEVRK